MNASTLLLVMFCTVKPKNVYCNKLKNKFNFPVIKNKYLKFASILFQTMMVRMISANSIVAVCVAAENYAVKDCCSQMT